MKRRYPLLALSLVLVPQLAFAQAAAGPAAPIRDSEKEPALEGNYVPAGPAGRTDNFVRGIDFDLQASEDGATASAQVGGYAVRNHYDDTNEIGRASCRERV